MLNGKTIVITGVSSGIGARTAELAIAQGADVIGIDISDPPANHGAILKGDISTPGGIAAIVERLPPRIDALLNIAGVSGTGGSAITLAINFYGLRLLSENLAGRIREGGAIVNVASVAGYGWRTNLARAKVLVGVPGFPDIAKVLADNDVPNEIGYPLSKELLLLWTQIAAHQPLFKARNIRVNAVSPGPVETPILAQFRSVLGDAKVDSDIGRTGRAGTASDIAPVILFAASDAARWINGANLATDGGLEASINADVLGF